MDLVDTYRHKIGMTIVVDENFICILGEESNAAFDDGAATVIKMIETAKEDKEDLTVEDIMALLDVIKEKMEGKV